jgi:hypothetical protein
MPRATPDEVRRSADQQQRGDVSAAVDRAVDHMTVAARAHGFRGAESGVRRSVGDRRPRVTRAGRSKRDDPV